MRGADITQEPLFTTIKLDERVPHDHPLRSIKILFDQALTHIDWKLSLIYSERGRESIPPERLLRALLLQILFSIRSERQHRITLHVARNNKRPSGSAIDGRTSHKTGYAASQIVRKRVEEPFGWGKTVGHLRQLKVKGLAKVNSALEMTMMAYNLVRMAKLQGQSVR